MQTVTILGVGRAGGALAIALDRAGIRLDTLILNSKPADVLRGAVKQVPIDDVVSVRSDILVIATPDPQIRVAAERIAEFYDRPKVALHLSGSLSSAELEPLQLKGIAVGSMHPLVSISDSVLGAERFPGAYFCIEGDAAAVKAATALVRAVGGKPFAIETSFKPLYHAAAVMASGNITAVFDTAVEMLSNCGLTRAEAHTVLLPLLSSTVANLAGHSSEESLTGPFVRGDVDALQRHLNAFERVIGDDIRRLYLMLAQRSIEIAGRLPGRETAALAEAISVAKQKSGC